MRVFSVCVGKKYPAEWVLRLKNMVERHSNWREFHCITDKDIPGVICHEPEPDLPGWWQKVALFKPGYEGDKVYFDLDVVITGNLHFLESCLDKNPHSLNVRDDFSYSVKNPGHGNPLLGYHGTVNSSVMVWSDEYCRDVWDLFLPEEMQTVHGDQNWITRCLHPKGKIAFLPEDKILSYKYHIQRGRKPQAITVFHGEPKVTQLNRKDSLRVAWES